MNKHLYALLVLFLALPFSIKAQDEISEKTDTLGRLDFLGIPMTGTIEEFGDKLKHHFQLKRMMGAERNWIFQGFIYGRECPFQVFYTKKSRQVFRIIVMPKNLEPYVWVDSLSHDYGEPIEMELGYMWQRPEGTILLRVIDGYDPALIYLDKVGQEAYKEEEKKRK